MNHHAVEQTDQGKGAARTERACHPVAALFPPLEGDALTALAADIREHGVREAGWLDEEGRILDGRNRDRVCRSLGIDMPWRVYPGAPGTEIDFLISLNLHRRHLTEDQRAAIAADLATMRQGERTDLRPIGQKLSQTAAAKAMEIAPRRVRRAAALKKASPILHEKVKAGKVRIIAAMKEIAKAKPKPTKKTKCNATLRKLFQAFTAAEQCIEQIEGRMGELSDRDRRELVRRIDRIERHCQYLRELGAAA